ncbi:MAG: class I SAM-dependent methyltransferase, partial [Deltaproteobacteria bacterium]|nr:class I SAM-dependent methyltransferase [Deltaproteobacteria bacterium]
MLRAMRDEDPYRSPLHYDLEYQDKTEDVAWYVGLARARGGPVLELGCGNGRITLEIARVGAEVHGIDKNPQMLQDLERKLRAAPEEVRLRVRYVLGDFLELEGPARHPLVILPFNAIHHCHHHREVLRLLHGVRSCLRPKGLFAMDMYRPYPELYQRDPEEHYCERDFTHPHSGAQIHSWEQSW